MLRRNMAEQKCTVEELIKMLDKITKEQGFGDITQITLRPDDYYSLTYTNDLYK